MRVLRPDELKELTEGAMDNAPCAYVDPELIDELVSRGLLICGPALPGEDCDFNIYTTEQGKLALRVHSAYLASIGEAS